MKDSHLFQTLSSRNLIYVVNPLPCLFHFLTRPAYDFTVVSHPVLITSEAYARNIVIFNTILLVKPSNHVEKFTYVAKLLADLLEEAEVTITVLMLTTSNGVKNMSQADLEIYLSSIVESLKQNTLQAQFCNFFLIIEVIKC